MLLLRLFLIQIAIASLSGVGAGQPPMAPAVANTIDPIPAGWTGPVFELSKDFPTSPPAADPKPWKTFDFRTQPEQYIRAVLDYCREGNEAVDWAGQNNAVRKWYHAPGLVKGNNGREFIHGLTRERTSLTKELSPTQTQPCSNWAVGLYNPTAAYVVGQVWQDPANPKTDGVKFADGAVGVKLLFTTAPTDQIPFLANSMEWQANVALSGSNSRSPRTVRLLQVDVAVRDDRADSTTGWVFGTFMYQNDAPGTGSLDRLVPVGLMWGNDPDLTPAKAATGVKPTESWINPASKSSHFGWNGRLNGPVDNPISSCLSCHSRAGFEQTNDLVFPASATDDEKMAYFTNVKAGDPYTAGVNSYDFSLQIGIGVRNFPPTTAAAAVRAAAVPPGFNPRAGGIDPQQPADDSGPDPARKGPTMAPARPSAAKGAPGERGATPLVLAGAIVVVVLVLALAVLRKRR